MRPSAWSIEPPILVVSSSAEDALVLRAALDRVGLPHTPADDAVTAMRAISNHPATFGGIVVGNRGGQVSGLSLCGLARDAGCSLPILLLTADDCATIAALAARLRVTVLWQPVSNRRLEIALRQLFTPRRQCLAS